MILSRTTSILTLLVILFAAPALSTLCASPQAASPQATDSEDEWSDVIRTRWADPHRSPMTYAEFLRLHPQDTPFSVASEETTPTGGRNGGGSGLLLLLVNSDLKPKIQTALDGYVADIVEEGYTVTVLEALGGTPKDLKATITGYLGSGLIGVLLVGDFAVPWYEVDGESFPCDLFYMDLDGDWIDSEPNGVYDQHVNNETPEIFVGRLTAGPLQGLGFGTEEAKVNKYFAKAHDYRRGLLTADYRALAYPDDDWSTFKACGMTNIYDDTTVVNVHSETTGEDYRRRLTENYEWIHVCVHSSPWAHYFSPSGMVDFWDVRNTDPIAHFYNLFACSNCRYVETDYMGGWYVFADTYGLAAVGSTKSGSMLDFKSFYGPLGEHKTLGQAFKEWWIVQHPYTHSDKTWFYGLTLLGDPLLVPAEAQVFAATPRTISASNGGWIFFEFDLNEKHYAYRSYEMLASTSGTTPRTPVENILVPLVFDPVTKLVHSNANSSMFINFKGNLNLLGDGSATFNLKHTLDPSWVGTVIDFCLVITQPADYATRPLSVLIQP